MLEKLGYSVTCFTRSLEAVKAVEMNPGQYDLIFTDMTMPGLTGLQLAEKVYKVNPDIPIILCSGLGETMEKRKFSLPCIKTVLKKPVTVQKLSQVLQHTLSD